VSDLAQGWVWTTLGDASELIRGVTFKKEQARSSVAPGYSPVLRAGNISTSLLLDEDLIYVPDEMIHPVQWLSPNDIVLAASSGSIKVVGKSAALKSSWRGSFGAFCSVVRPNAAIEPRFLGWFLKSDPVRNRWSEMAKGTNINNLKRDHILLTPLPLPPIEEQRRIVDAIEEHLTRIDAAVDSMRRATAQIGRFRQTSFDQLFDQTGWKWTTLGEIAEIKGGVTKDAKKQSNPKFVEVPYLRVANVQRGHLDLNEVTKIRVPPATLDALRLVVGDILLNEGGDRDKLGRGWVWEGQVENCIHQNHVFRARLRDPGMNPRFFSTHANTWGRSWFETNGKQTTNLASISLSTLKMLPVPIPSNEEQALVVAELERRTSVVDSLLQSLERGSREAESLRRSILAMAFSGRLVPQDPEEEPAGVLLERIRAERDSSPTSRGNSKLVAS